MEKEKIYLAAFTEKGCQLAERAADFFRGEGFLPSCCTVKKFAGRQEFSEFPGGLKSWTGSGFEENIAAFVFVGAAGIAVRSIAPFVEDKMKDPAVLVVDEAARYVIPILSGHVGRANYFAGMLAEELGALPVITTATDVRNRFAVDVFAGENGLIIGERKLAKEVSAALLSGKEVGFESDFPVRGQLPAGLVGERPGKDGLLVKISVRQDQEENTLHLYPRSVILGIGCRKGIKKEEIEEAVQRFLWENHIAFPAVKGIASIDIKRNEQGLLEWAGERGLPASFYSADTLLKVEGEFLASAFVKQVTGVDNVCERAALSHGAGKKTRLIARKFCFHKVTVAAAAEEVIISL